MSPRVRDALLHVAIALVVTAPVALRPRSVLLGSPNVDVWNHAWGPWWWWHSISSGTLPWQTALLRAPDGGTLWFIDPVLAGLGAPLVPLLGTAGAFNAVLLAEVVFMSWAGRRLARALGAGEAASWVGAVAFTASAWVVCELHNGITEAVNIAPVALALAWGHEATEAPSARAWAKAGLGVGLATLASPYLGLGVGLALAARGLPAIRWAWLGGIVAAAVAALPLLALRTQLHSPDAIIKHPESMNLQLALHNAVDPRTFVAPLGFRSVDLSAEGFEHSLYLGLLALALAAVGLVRQRRAAPWWLAALLVSLLCSLGPYLYWEDGWLLVNGARLRMPWWWLQQLAPGLAVTHPLRLGVPALAIVAGLAAAGADRLLGRRAWVLAVLVGVDGLLLSGAPWPIANAPAEPPAAYASLSGDGAVLDLPTDAASTLRTSRYRYWQAASHHRPIPYAPDARASTSALISAPAFQALAALCRRRPDEQARMGSPPPGASTHPATLAARGVRWIVLHPDVDPAVTDTLREALEADLGPGQDTDGTLVWELSP